MTAFQPATKEGDVVVNVPLALQIAKAALCLAEPEWNPPEIWLKCLITVIR